MSAIRTQICLSADRRRWLEERRQLDHRSLVAVIREAIDACLAPDTDPMAALAATFGSVPDLEVPSRDEWDRPMLADLLLTR